MIFVDLVQLLKNMYLVEVKYSTEAVAAQVSFFPFHFMKQDYSDRIRPS